MITGHRSQFEARCRQRGYTLAEAMPCVVSQDGDLWTVDETHPAYPRARPGLGDMVAKTLAAVGIKPCGGCKQRQAALNRIGRRFGIG